MAKSPEAFRTISEVADWLGVPAHVLRFWESKFPQVKPVKRAGGRRYYRPGDMMLLGGIKKLLHDDGLTIKGVQKILRENGVGHVSDLSQTLDEIAGDGDTVEAAADTVTEAKGETEAAGPDTSDETVIRFHGRRPAPAPGNDPGQIDMDLAPVEPATPQAGDSPHPPPEPASDSADHAPAEDAAAQPAPDQPAAADTAPAAPARARPAGARGDPAAGPLSRLSGIQALDAEQARAAAPLAQALRDWLDRTAAARAV